MSPTYADLDETARVDMDSDESRDNIMQPKESRPSVRGKRTVAQRVPNKNPYEAPYFERGTADTVVEIAAQMTSSSASR